MNLIWSSLSSIDHRVLNTEKQVDQQRLILPVYLFRLWSRPCWLLCPELVFGHLSGVKLK